MALGAALAVLLLLQRNREVTVGPHVVPTPPPPVAAVRIVDGTVQRGSGKSWKAVGGDFKIAPGEKLRTSGDGLALITLPWMEILIGGDAAVGLTPSTVLSAFIEHGRIEERATAGDILKVLTPEAEIRGRGAVVVSRSDTNAQTRISSLSGGFSVKAGRGTVFVDSGRGVLVNKGVPEIVDLPAPPKALTPGSDPAYVVKGKAARLAWKGSGRRYHVKVLSLSGDEVLLAREVDAPAIDVPTRWLGTFQWTVAAIADNGIEGPASVAGLFCVVEK